MRSSFTTICVADRLWLDRPASLPLPAQSDAESRFRMPARFADEQV